MKRHFFPLLTAFALLLPTTFYLVAPTALVLVTSGCKTANQSLYKGTGVVIVTVETAMKAWGAYVDSNHPPIEQRTAVKDAFEKYQKAMLAVTSAGAANAKILADKAADPATASTALSILNEAIANSGATLLDLENMLRTFGVRL